MKRNYIELPSIKLDYHNPPYNASKVALLVENRPDPLLAPVMLQFMSVVPPDWTFRFMGTEESLAHIGKSKAIQHQVSIGKLQLSYIPENMTTNGGEEISRFFTSKYLYETLLAPAEHLLVFQTDSKTFSHLVIVSSAHRSYQVSCAPVPDDQSTSFWNTTGWVLLGLGIDRRTAAMEVSPFARSRQ